jgi:translation initiation factor IF-2
MSEQETVKVYELAKELGIDSISLLDKLRDLNIKVKNHMSELGAEETRLARSSLGKKDESAKAPAKKKTTTVRKKAASTTSAAEAPAAAPATTVTAAPASAEGASAKSPIIRRRVKTEGGTEVVTQTTLGNSPKGSASEGAASHYEHSGTESAQASGGMTYEETPSTTYEESYAHTGSLGQGVEDTVTAAAVAPQDAPAGSGAETLAADTAAAASSAATAGAAPSAPSAPLLTPRPVAPRKSFLKIVDATPPPPRPIIKPVSPAAKSPITPRQPGAPGDKEGGFRIIRATKENLDQMVEEEAAKKRGGGGREAEIRPEDVRFADYRKKEMVFLPKKKRIPLGKELKRTQITQAKAQKRVVEMQDTITISDLANQLAVKAVDVVRKLMQMGQMVTINQSVDFDTASLVAAEYKHEVRNLAFKEETVLDHSQDAAESLEPRPPVVTIMGHVDHGKTTLLDSIREANVAGGEAGGITQHIGAYTVEKNGKLITFIDTPGHEAFTVMRARGANVTDIVILVVAADDGVMPQTREALSHAKAAKVPIIVAVNKIDKPGAQPDKVKQALAELDLLAEDWGGETMFVPVSALKKTGLSELLDAILLQSEVLDLKANSNSLVTGTVLEARLEKGRGPVMTVLISRGTLKVGDAIVSGEFAGKVKAMRDHTGATVNTATPGIAVEVLGMEGVPNAGEKFYSTATDADAREVARNRVDKARAKVSAPAGRASLDDLFAKIQAGSIKELGVILKADAFGSVEAIRDSVQKLSTDKVKVKVIHAAAGGITESDVLLATASGALIIGFNVRPETKARQLAEAEHIEIKCYNIIYELIDDVKNSMTGLLDKKKVEKFLGRAEVRQIFTVPKIGTIAGTAVIDGKILRGAQVRLLRDSRVIYEGKMSSLKRFKDDAKEVATGYECGIGIENFNDLKPGDIIEAFQIEMIAPTLDA